MEHMTPHATKYYNKQLMKYIIEDGLPAEEAEIRADQDLIEWSKPLPIPETPEEHWWE